jgi:divalent metal cation (Fe/Co/Zn/Cd) transporter
MRAEGPTAQLSCWRVPRPLHMTARHSGSDTAGDRLFHAPDRSESLNRARSLAVLTIAWNIVEGVVAVWAALAAGSIALLGFGVDSFVESTSGGVLLWRLLAENKAMSPQEIDRLDRRAHKLIAGSLLLLAGYIALDAATALWNQERPQPTIVGIVLTTISLLVMIWLARAKKTTAGVLGSRAMEADAFQTTACWWLSLIALGGMGLNALFGWWWADPLAALAMTGLLLREGRQAWRARPCC